MTAAAAVTYAIDRIKQLRTDLEQAAKPRWILTAKTRHSSGTPFRT